MIFVYNLSNKTLDKILILFTVRFITLILVKKYIQKQYYLLKTNIFYIYHQLYLSCLK